MLVARPSPPFLYPHPAYVLSQYRGMLGQYTIAYQADIGPWSELGMMLYRFGLPVPPPLMTALRIVAAPATLALAFIARARNPAERAAFYVLALSICYLMLFNPANEENTYGALAGILALSAAAAIVTGYPRWVAASLVAMCFALGADGYGTPIYHATRLWLKPMICIAYLAVLLPALWKGENRSEPGGDTFN